MKTLDQPKYVPKVSFLADEGMLKDYQERIKSYSKRAQEVLNIFTFDGVVRGSNFFANVALASEYLALPHQVLHDSELNPRFFRGNCEDLGLVLETNGDSYKRNDHNARNLFKQVKKRGLTTSPEAPVRISLRGLSLVEDKHSYYGLFHRLTDEAEVIQVPEFSYKEYRNEGYCRKFLETDERGVPKFLSNKEIGELTREQESQLRTFHVNEEGLAGLCLDQSLNLNSNWGGRLGLYSNQGGLFGLSGTNSRVAVISA